MSRQIFTSTCLYITKRNFGKTLISSLDEIATNDIHQSAVDINPTAQSQQTTSNPGTADHKEIEHFASVNPRDWLDERNGAFRALHSFNRVRIPWILAHFGQNLNPAQRERPLDGKRVLDVGCGAGILSLALCRLGADVTGLDATENVIEIAQKAKETIPLDLRTNATFVQGTIEEFALNQQNLKAFDAIVASEVVEHVLDLPAFVKSCCNLTKPNSPLFFTTINRTIWSRIFAKIFAEDILRLLPKGLHDYDKFVTPEELRTLLVDEQCRIGPTLGLIYNPLLNEWNWSNFSEINYALVALTRV